MGRRSKEDKRFMNTPPTRAEVVDFVKNYHREVITSEIDTASQSAIRVILMLLTETGVVEKDKLGVFMKKVREMSELEAKVAPASPVPADNPQ